MPDKTTRDAELRDLLGQRRSELQGQTQNRLRDWRSGRATDGRDDLEKSDADNHNDMEFALAQMSAETLARIDEALGRLEAGKYGFCFECEDEISERRLRALPFAVRCQECEGNASSAKPDRPASPVPALCCSRN